MKPEQISDALNQLDDDLIYETAKIRSSKRKKKKSSGFNWSALGTVAACLGLLVIGNIVVTKFVKPPVNVGESTESTQIAGTETSGNESAGNETAGNVTTEHETPDNETPESTAPDETETTETTTAVWQLPILDISFCAGSDGSGGSDFVYDDISLLTAISPWSPELSLEVLPVYRNTKYNETFVPYGFTEDDMTAEVNRIVSAMGEEILECYYTEATTYQSAYMTAKTYAASIVINGKGYTTIKFENNELPEDYRITSESSLAARNEAMSYLVHQFNDLLAFEQPEIILRSRHDFSYSGEYSPHFIVYDRAGDIADNLLNRYYNYAEFFFTEDGNLASIVLQHGLACAEKIGDYPIISPEEARAQLLAGHFFYQGPSEFGQNGVDEEYIAGVELTYLQSNQNQILIPYYCFYVLCPDYEFTEEVDPELIEELAWYQDCYVPAVDGQYITGVPANSGNLN